MTSPANPASLQTWILRIGLAGAGAVLLQTSLVISGSRPLVYAPLNIWSAIIAGGGGLLCLILAAAGRVSHKLRWIILAAFIAEVLLQASVWHQDSGTTDQPSPQYVQIDSALYTDFAARLLLRGRNPYMWNYSGVMTLYGAGTSGATLTLSGSQESPFPYPALSFLLTAPFQMIGLSGTFYLLVITHILLLILLFLHAPPVLQPLILLPLGVSFNFSALTLLGVMDVVWITLLVGMIIFWKRPIVRAMLFGLAISFKQGPWLLTPFLVIRLWLDDDVSHPRFTRILQFVGISGLVFTLINAPFMLASPVEWLRGVTEPINDSLVYLSQGGLAGITQFGLVHLPRTYYTIAMLLVLLTLMWVYWRHYPILKHAFWLLPSVALWFSYRALVTYWVYLFFPLLAALRYFRVRNAVELVRAKPSWKFTGVVTASCTLLLIGLAVVMQTPVLIRALVELPVLTENGRIRELIIRVTNDSTQVLTPRFALQHRDTSTNPVALTVIDGEDRLTPGASEVYRVANETLRTSPALWEAWQLVVTDAQGDYLLRAVTTFEPDRSYLYPDAIQNPAFRFWPLDRPLPLTWRLTATSRNSRVDLEHVASRPALSLTLSRYRQIDEENRISVAQQISFPAAPLGIWLYYDPDTQPENGFYGVEFDDGEHLLQIAFADVARTTERVSPNQLRLLRVVKPRQWVYQELDLPALYRDAGWDAPPLIRRSFRRLRTDFRLIDLRFVLSANGNPRMLKGYFGAIEQPEYVIKPEQLMAETFDDPVDYYLRLGDAYLAGGNYHRAIEAYQHVLDFAPDNQPAQEKLERANSYLAQEYP